MRPAPSVALALSVLTCAAVGLAAAPRPAVDLLAPMRLAIGGDAAIDAIAQFSVSGSLTRRGSGVSGSSGYEVVVQMPDKYLATTRTVSDPVGLPPGVNMPSISSMSASGFNGDDPIRRTASDTLPNGMPSVFRVPQSTAPEDVAEARRRTVSSARREFLRFVLPRFGKSFPGADVRLEDAGTASVDGRAVYQVKVTDWGNRVHVLAIDTVTNLPVSLTWQDRPVVSVNLGTVMNTGFGPPSMPKFPSDPTAGMPDVDHVVVFSKFSRDNGLLWPREISKTVDGQPAEKWNFGKVNLKPKITPDTFNPLK